MKNQNAYKPTHKQHTLPMFTGYSTPFTRAVFQNESSAKTEKGTLFDTNKYRVPNSELYNFLGEEGMFFYLLIFGLKNR